MLNPFTFTMLDFNLHVITYAFGTSNGGVEGEKIHMHDFKQVVVYATVVIPSFGCLLPAIIYNKGDGT